MVASPVMTVQEKLYTIDEFWEIAQRPENQGRRLELLAGEIADMPPSSPQNGILAVWICHLMVGVVIPHGLGYVTGPDTGYQLGPNTVRLPDAAYITKERAGGIPKKVFPVGPDLAVEVISPSESATEINDKVNLYFSAGTRQVWLVYPTTRTIHLYRAVNQVQIMTGDEVLNTSGVLPGFTVKVADIFTPLSD